jgi:hypothetical protein
LMLALYGFRLPRAAHFPIKRLRLQVHLPIGHHERH